MKKLIIPLLFAALAVACDRQPVAPDLDVRPEFRATHYESDLDFGAVSWTDFYDCLGEDATWSASSLIMYYRDLLKPDGSWLWRLTRIEWSDDLQLQTASGDVWNPHPPFVWKNLVMVEEDGESRKIDMYQEMSKWENADTGEWIKIAGGYRIIKNAHGDTQVDAHSYSCQTTRPGK
jgi:hypothetical protein